MNTTDLRKFGYRELEIASDLIKNYANNGCDFFGTEAKTEI